MRRKPFSNWWHKSSLLSYTARFNSTKIPKCSLSWPTNTHFYKNMSYPNSEEWICMFYNKKTGNLLRSIYELHVYFPFENIYHFFLYETSPFLHFNVIYLIQNCFDLRAIDLSPKHPTTSLESCTGTELITQESLGPATLTHMPLPVICVVNTPPVLLD